MAKKNIATSGLIIGVDAKRAVLNNTGLGNFSRYYINILSRAYPTTQFRLYSPEAKENDRLSPLLARENVSLITPSLRPGCGLTRAWWRSIDMPVMLGKDGIALYHGVSNELPLTIKGVCPTVVTIHDLIYRLVPENYNAIDRRLYDFKYRRSARIATRVAAISERTKANLVELYGIDPAKIDVIYQGIDPIFSLAVDSQKRIELRQKYKLPERFILAVGTVERRKNLLLAVNAMPQLPADVKLVVVGRMQGDYANEVKNRIASLGLADRVMHLQVPFTELPTLYSMADIASYTSRYEGFGLPIVEALTMNTPVIAATGSCLEEAGGEGAIYVDPDDVAAYSQAANHLLEDLVFHDKIARLGKRHVARFSADNFAKATMACYQKAFLL